MLAEKERHTVAIRPFASDVLRLARGFRTATRRLRVLEDIEEEISRERKYCTSGGRVADIAACPSFKARDIPEQASTRPAVSRAIICTAARSAEPASRTTIATSVPDDTDEGETLSDGLGGLVGRGAGVLMGGV